MPATIQTIVKPTRARGLDTSGNNNHAQIYSGRALEFDGVLDYLDGPSFTDIGVTGDVTVSFWGKYNAGSGIGMFWGIYAALSDGMGVVIDRNNNTLEIFDDSEGNDIANIYATTMNPDTWYRIVFVLDNSEFKLYMNGVLVGSGTNVETHWSGNWTPNIFLGVRSGAVVDETYGYKLDGAMSDFQVWDKVWTQDDVTYDYLNPEQLALNRGGTSLTNSNLKLWYPMNEGHRGNQSYVLDASNTGLGDNIVTNGTFDTDTHWHKGSSGGISISDGKLRWDGTQTNWAAAQNNQDGASNTTVSGQTYRAKFDWTRSTSTLQFKTGAAHLNIGSGTSGSADFIFIADGSYWYFTGNADMIATVDNVEVYPINDKHNATTAFFGDEMITESKNRDFGSSSDWGVLNIAGGSLTEPSNKLQVVTSTDNEVEGTALAIGELTAPVAGRTYRISAKLDNTAGATTPTIQFRFAGATAVNVKASDDSPSDGTIDTTEQEYYADVVATNTSGSLVIQNVASTDSTTFTIDDVSVKEVGTATGWTDADQQLDIPQTALQSYNQLAWNYQLNDSTNPIKSSVTPAFGTDNFAVSFSFFTNEMVDQKFMSQNKSGTDGRFIFYFSEGTNSIKIYSDSGGVSVGYTSITDAVIEAGKWFHIIVVWNRTAGTVTSYVNGQLQSASQDISGISGGFNGGGEFYPFRYTGDMQFVGSLTEIAYWKNTTFSASDANELYNEGLILDAREHSKSSTLIHYWKNNGLSNWKDLVGSDDLVSNNMEETMLITAGADSSRDSQGFFMNRQRTTNSLNLYNNNGMSDGDWTHGLIPSSGDDDLAFIGVGDGFSVSCWVKCSELQSSTGMILSRNDNTDGWRIMLNSSNKLQIQVEENGNLSTAVTDNAISVDTWYHIVGTFDGDPDNDGSGTVSLYLNGVTGGATTNTDTSANDMDASSSKDGVYIGMHQNSNSEGFFGEIDDIAIYNGVLSQAEVTRNYNAGKRSHK